MDNFIKVVINLIRAPAFFSLSLEMQLKVLLWVKKNQGYLKSNYMLQPFLLKISSFLKEISTHFSINFSIVSLAYEITQDMYYYNKINLDAFDISFPEASSILEKIESKVFKSDLVFEKSYKEECLEDILLSLSEMNMEVDEENNQVERSSQNEKVQESQFFDELNTNSFENSSDCSNFCATNFTNEIYENNKTATNLNKEICDNISQLVEKLENYDSSINSQIMVNESEFEILTENPDTNAICKLIPFDRFSEDSLIFFLNTVVTEQISFLTSQIIFSYSLLPRILKLDKTATRGILNSISLCAKNQPEALIESFLLPLSTNNSLNSHQVELINRVLKNLRSDLQFEFAKKNLQTKFVWNLSTLDLFAKIFTLKESWISQIFSLFVHQLNLHLIDIVDQPKVGEKVNSILWSVIMRTDLNSLKNLVDLLKQIVTRFKTPLSEKIISKLKTFL